MATIPLPASVTFSEELTMQSVIGRFLSLIVKVPEEWFGALCDLAEKLASNRGGEWYNELLRFLKREPCWVVKPILTWLRDLVLPADQALSTSKDFWEEAGVKVMGDNFKAHCIEVRVKTVPKTAFVVHKLERASLDAPILVERGEKARMPLSQIAAFLLANKKASGWFIFYPEELPDWAVYAIWYSDDGGWYVGALSVGDPLEWYAGRQVVSRK